jgi:Tfp pilus assembly protein PilO
MRISFSGMPGRVQMKDPRVVMRAAIGLLLVANLAAALIAFKPFGGSAADLSRQESDLQTNLAAMQARIATEKKLVDKVQAARAEGDDFLTKFFMNRKTTTSEITEELDRITGDAKIQPQGISLQFVEIPGSDTLQMLSITAGFQGTYESLTKFVNLVDKSPRFLIIESMQTAGVQNGKALTMQLRIDTFVRSDTRAAL